jgi:hypothetical protein
MQRLLAILAMREGTGNQPVRVILHFFVIRVKILDDVDLVERPLTLGDLLECFLC